MREQAGEDVRTEQGAECEQHVLDASEAAAQNERRYEQRGQRNAHVAADMRQLHARRDARELGAGGAHVGDHQREQRDRSQAHAVVLAHQPGQALAGHDSDPRAQLVEDHERHR